MEFLGPPTYLPSVVDWEQGVRNPAAARPYFFLEKKTFA